MLYEAKKHSIHHSSRISRIGLRIVLRTSGCMLATRLIATIAATTTSNNGESTLNKRTAGARSIIPNAVAAVSVSVLPYE